MTKPKKSKIKDGKLPAGQLRQEIFKLFKRHSKKRFNPKQIAKKLKIDNSKDSISDALNKLVEMGQLVALEDFKFKIKPTTATGENPAEQPGRSRKYTKGYVDMTRNGDAYIVSEELEHDVHISQKYLNGALHGDMVEINYWTPRGRQRTEGEVRNVIKRATEHFMGTLRLTRNFGVVIPDKLNMPVDIVVKEEDLKGAREGDKVVVKITKWHNEKYPSPLGVITNVLGKVGSSDLEMKAILINNGFPLDFPQEVLAESEDLPDHIPLMEINRRNDFREVTTFTIDPEDAKDFDDALSVRFLEDDAYEVGVHIADVSHYVKPGSALDKEAFQRATSVYLVDRVLPMLPEKISNGLCSLRPNEDKLTFSAVFVFDKNDKIKSRWFGKTVIHSDRRFSYEEAQKVLETSEGDFAKELNHLNKVAEKLRKQRFKNGSIDFETEEVRFRLDEEGVPIEVYIKERKAAHMLIEDFMLLANKEVALYIEEKGKGLEIPFVYRVHDFPDTDKVAEFARFAHEMGFEMNVSTPQSIGQSYNQLTKAAKTNDALKILEPIAIRTMAKAEYSVNNIGHYGLGFGFYAHFTSPIRRYADVLAHRILEGNIDGRNMRWDKARLEAQCKHISMQERKAMDAERESVKYKQAEFMRKHVGDVFDGYVSGMLERGIFVELKNSKCEGMVGFETMSESFEVENGRLRAKGRNSGRIFKMGDLVKVKIVSVDLSRRQIEMELAEESPAKNAPDNSSEKAPVKKPDPARRKITSKKIN